jgi:DNA-binding transcriptional regulator LsrR (DeoR family)
VLGRPKGLTKAAQQKAATASVLYREGTLTTAEICEQLNISIPTLYNYLKQMNITLKVNAPAYEIINTVPNQ